MFVPGMCLFWGYVCSGMFVLRIFLFMVVSGMYLFWSSIFLGLGEIGWL
jgi:hypothetical protein